MVSIYLCQMIAMMVLIALAMFGILPLWTVPVFGLISLAFIYKTGAIVVHRIMMWNAYGNRLKEAYSAKFGENNPAFGDEVDGHIKVMKSLGRGYTKSVHLDKLKRLSSFVEVPFIIPEEDGLTEEQKTRAFDNGGENL